MILRPRPGSVVRVHPDTARPVAPSDFARASQSGWPASASDRRACGPHSRAIHSRDERFSQVLPQHLARASRETPTTSARHLARHPRTSRPRISRDTHAVSPGVSTCGSSELGVWRRLRRGCPANWVQGFAITEGVRGSTVHPLRGGIPRDLLGEEASGHPRPLSLSAPPRWMSRDTLPPEARWMSRDTLPPEAGGRSRRNSWGFLKQAGGIAEYVDARHHECLGKCVGVSGNARGCLGKCAGNASREMMRRPGDARAGQQGGLRLRMTRPRLHRRG